MYLSSQLYDMEFIYNNFQEVEVRDILPQEVFSNVTHVENLYNEDVKNFVAQGFSFAFPPDNSFISFNAYGQGRDANNFKVNVYSVNRFKNNLFYKE